MEFITTNLTGIVRNETMEGREYLVVPMIMMVEGVLNGSSGSLYYPAEELSKFAQVWNHKPVVVYHPTMNGKALSACDQEIINTHKIGLIMNTNFDGKRLKAEAWLEKERIGQVDSRVMDAVVNNQMMEVSTGLFTENEVIEGTFNGTTYNAIARNYRPDHLAILPDQIGACSIADGAGLLRTNSANRNELEKALEYLGVANETSHNEIHQSLRAELDIKNKNVDVWIDNIYDDWFVFEKEDKYYRQKYLVVQGKVEFSENPVEVDRKIVYEDLNGAIFNFEKEEINMDKAEFVKGLISNTATQWVEADREFLEGLEENQLEKMTPIANEKKEPEVKKIEDSEDKKEKPPVSEAPVSNSEKTADEFIADAPAEIREVLQESLQTYASKKSGLIEEIIANTKNIFTKEQLSNMSVNDLTAIASFARSDEAEKATVSYAGLAPVANATGEVEKPLEAPVMNFDAE